VWTLLATRHRVSWECFLKCTRSLIKLLSSLSAASPISYHSLWHAVEAWHLPFLAPPTTRRLLFGSASSPAPHDLARTTTIGNATACRRHGGASAIDDNVGVLCYRVARQIIPCGRQRRGEWATTKRRAGDNEEENETDSRRVIPGPRRSSQWSEEEVVVVVDVRVERGARRRRRKRTSANNTSTTTV
jgi:hypothetical protein